MLLFSNSAGKTPSESFDSLRRNGEGRESIEIIPFMLSLTKHGPAFFSSLLMAP